MFFAASTKPSVRFFELFFDPYAFFMVERFSCSLFFDPYAFFMVERFSCTLEIHSVLFFSPRVVHGTMCFAATPAETLVKIYVVIEIYTRPMILPSFSPKLRLGTEIMIP